MTQTMMPATREMAMEFGSFMALILKKSQELEDPQSCSFYRPSCPSISLQNYAERLVEYLPVSPECFVIAATYITRLESIVTERTAHRLMITAIVMAVKNQDDQRPTMRFFSNIGGVEPSELIEMEKELARLLDFRTFVQPEQYESAAMSLRALIKSHCLLEVAQEQVAKAHNDSTAPSTKLGFKGAASRFHISKKRFFKTRQTKVMNCTTTNSGPAPCVVWAH